MAGKLQRRIEVRSHQRPGLLTFVFIGFVALAALGLAWSRDEQSIAVLWLPNALLLTALLRNRRQVLVQCLAVGWIAGMVAAIVIGAPSWRPLFFCSVNIVEVLIVYMVMRRDRASVDLADLATLRRFSFVAGLVAPMVSGALATGSSFLLTGTLDHRIFLAWTMGHSLGLLIATPLLMITADGWRARHQVSRKVVRDAISVLLVGLGVTVAIFAQSRFPVLFLVCPIVLFAAFRLGIVGTTITIAMLSLVASVATAMGVGPMMLVPGAFATKLLVLQVFLVTNFALGLPVAAMLRGLAQTRAELRDSRDFARSMLENMREVIFRTDAAGRWVFLNPAWEALTGYTVAESLGWRTTRLLHPDDLAEARVIYSRLASGEIDECVLKQCFFSADGERHRIEVSVRALRDEANGLVGTIGNIRDITERHKAEQALRESERRFHALAELAPVGIFRADVHGHATYLNPAWSRLSGLPEASGLGMGWLDAVAPEDRRRVLAGWQSAVTRRRSLRGEFRFLRPNRSLSWADSISTPEIDDQGEVVGHIGVQLDITDRKLSEQSLAEREALLTLLASNATDAVFRLSLDGICLYASPSVQEVIGVAPSSLLGHSMLDRFHPDDADRVLAAHRALARGEAERLVVSYRSRPIGQPGDWKWLEANCGLVRDADTGTPLEIITSIRDISKRKALEFDLQAARDSAQAAASVKASFLANMSHEIRTPMNGVIGFTELLLDSDLTDEQRGQAQLVADSGRAMMRLLNDILDISKIEAGQMQIARDAIDLRHALGGCIKLMGPLASEKHLSLQCDFDPRIPDLTIGDGLRIRQIVLNLLGNALKFTAQGSVTVLARVADDGATIDIEVRDTGIGIARDRQTAIFEQFVQSDVSTARKYGGTGLGLAISQQLAKLMNGELTLTSELGVGTSFFLRLPLETPAPAQPVDSIPAIVQATTDGSRPTARLRILLAEDNPINQLLASAMIERLGCAVVVAGDGAQAVAEVERAFAGQEPFALVLMDMQMPEMDGIEATRLIRANGIGADRLPIMALTANAYPDDISACLVAGMQGHLAKPLQMVDLAGVLARTRDNVEPFSTAQQA